MIEAWRQNLQYTLSLDLSFANFLGDSMNSTPLLP